MIARGGRVMFVFALVVGGFASLPSSRAQQVTEENAASAGEIDVFLAGAASDRIDVLLHYLEKGFDPDTPGKSGNTALIVAAGAGAGSAVSLLLARNADPNVANAEGWTPLMEATYRDRTAIARRLLDAGADPKRVEKRKGLTALHVAARGKDPAVIAALAAAGADVDARDTVTGRTALMRALGSRKPQAIEIVSELMVLGARVDTVDRHGMTALMIAADSANPKKIGLILDAGVDLEARSKDGRTALSIVARYGNFVIVNRLMKRGAKPDVPGGIAPIAEAAASQSQNSVIALLEAGADPDLPGVKGKTALMIAAGVGNAAIVDLLLKRKADPNARGSRDGSTALMWAANSGQAAIVRRLLEAGAKVSVVADDGWTAVEAARMAGHDDIARLLAKQI